MMTKGRDEPLQKKDYLIAETSIRVMHILELHPS